MGEIQSASPLVAGELPVKKSKYVDLAAISSRERGKGLFATVFVEGIPPILYFVAPFPIAVLLVIFWIRGDIGLGMTFFGVSGMVAFDLCIFPSFLRKFRDPVGFACTHCDKHVSTDPLWVCGYCNTVHGSRGQLNSIERPCSMCKRLPKGYRCYHCGKTVCLDASCDEQNPAYAKNAKYPSNEELLAASRAEAATINPVEKSKTSAESTIEKMIAEKVAFSMITEKICELRDMAIKQINAAELDPDTKKTRIDFEKQWAKTKLESIKMQTIRGSK
jgi:hypothetical protein